MALGLIVLIIFAVLALKFKPHVKPSKKLALVIIAIAALGAAVTAGYFFAGVILDFVKVYLFYVIFGVVLLAVIIAVLTSLTNGHEESAPEVPIKSTKKKVSQPKSPPKK